VQVRNFNIIGKRVAEVMNAARERGYHELSWDAKNSAGVELGSGVYFLRLEARALDGTRSFTDVKKMLLVR
jgi:hypothetical protein